MKDRRTFDFTCISTSMTAAYNKKVEKYRNDGFAEPLIPIVVTPRMEMHPGSVESMRKYINIASMFKMLAVNTANQTVQRINSYNDRKAESNLRHAETVKCQPDSRRFVTNASYDSQNEKAYKGRFAAAQ